MMGGDAPHQYLARQQLDNNSGANDQKKRSITLHSK
jgi:hypothetical protein